MNESTNREDEPGAWPLHQARPLTRKRNTHDHKSSLLRSRHSRSPAADTTLRNTEEMTGLNSADKRPPGTQPGGRADMRRRFLTELEMGRAGLEHPRNPAGNTPVSDSGGSKSGNVRADSAPPTPPATPTDPDLAAIVAAWPSLPPAIRAGMLALVGAAVARTAPEAPTPRLGARG